MKSEQQQPLLNHRQPDQSGKGIQMLSLFKYADKQDRLLMFFGSLAAIGAGVASPLFMIFFSQISQIFVPGNESTAERQGRDLFFKLMAVGILTWICHSISIWGWNKSGSRQTLRLKKLYYQALLHQEMSWFDSNETSKITAEISQNSLAIEAAIGQKISFLITALVTSIFGLVYSLVKCWQMSLYLTIFLPFMLQAGYLMMKSMTIRAKTSRISYESASSIAQSAFGTIRTVKILVNQLFVQSKFQKALSLAQPNLKAQTRNSALASGFFNLIMMGIYSFGFFIGKQTILDNPGKYQASQIISTFFCFMVAGQTIGQISPIFKILADAKIATEKIYKLMSANVSNLQKDEGMKIDQIQSITFQNIYFNYSKESQQSDWILKDINLIFKKGTITALVGSSGSGKSTIGQLLMNFYNPAKGSIKVNEENLKNLNSLDYRKKIGYVGQEPVLFSMTIKQNIQLSNSSISDDQVHEALKDSYSLEFVDRFQKRDQTYVGNKGTQLSGGQKQRIAIARALAKKCDVIILDEATSALDIESESKVQKTIANLAAQGKIVIVIAHRLSTIRNANNIVVLDKGQIVETGSHQQLLGMGNYYYKLIKTQLEQKHQMKQSIKEEGQSLSNKEIKQQKKNSVNDSNQVVNKTRNRLQIYTSLAKFTKQKKYLILLGSICALLNGSANPLFNISFSNVMGLLDSAQENNSLINFYCLAFLLVSLLAAFSHFFHFFLFGIYGEELVFNLRVAIFSKILKFPASFFDRPQNAPGAISTKLSQNSYHLHNALTGILSVLCLNISTILLSIFFAFYFCWKLAFIAMIFSPILTARGAIAVAFLKRINKDSDQIQKNTGAFVSDTIGNIKTVKSLGGYDQFLNIFQQKIDNMSIVVSKKFLKMGILQGFSRSSSILVYAIVFWVAAALFAHQQFQDPRDALIAIFCIVFSATTVGQNSQLMPDLAKAQKSANQLLDMLQSKDQQQIAEQSQDKSLKGKKIKGKIQFKNVDFSYPNGGKPILSQFNLKINKKQKVCIVGASGSGKSTIFLILSRLYPIQQGQILIDNIPIEKYNLYEYRKQLGLLTQEPAIFKGSIQENILSKFKDKKKYVSRLQKYSKICLVDQIVQNQQQGYMKDVGENGSLVSGGQKQRIAIARCLIKKPRILLMDQPTSALDVETESKLFENLQEQFKKKTVIYSAHRLCTVKFAEKIIVMKQGRIIEQGAFSVLMESNGQFHKLMTSDNQSK